MKTLCCDPLLEQTQHASTHQDSSNEGSQHAFYGEITAVTKKACFDTCLTSES